MLNYTMPPAKETVCAFQKEYICMHVKHVVNIEGGCKFQF